jgi:vitamin B12 transporter
MRVPLFGTLFVSSLALAVVDEPTELDPIIVTATRTPQTADDTLASVTLVTREEIERRQVRSVADALRGGTGCVPHQ